MPNYQGKLDGLCGVYAIVNAFEYCGVNRSDGIWRSSFFGLAERRWPQAIWQGTTLHDLMRMIRCCQNNIIGAAAIKISYPFLKRPPRNTKEYWERFDEKFSEPNLLQCAIIGLDYPSAHWIVAARETRKNISFYDTDPLKLYKRKHRNSLHVGQSAVNGASWIMAPRDLILFEAP